MASGNETAVRRRELGRKYYERFGHVIGIPFGADWWATDENYIREIEIALETGIPFEPGTERWDAVFAGFYDDLPEGAII